MMKPTKFWLLAAASLAFAACSTDEDLGGKSGPVEARISAGIDAMKTRAVGNKWFEDAIGVTVQSAPNSDMAERYRNVRYETEASGSETASFTPASTKIFFEDAAETVSFSAYAPYQPSNSANLLPGNDGVIAVSTQNSNGTQADQQAIDFLYASGAQASLSKPNVSFTEAAKFGHKMARIDLSLKISTEDGFETTDVAGISNLILGGLAHEGTFNVTDGTATATGAAVNDWEITACAHSDNGTTRTYSLIVLPQDVSSEGLSLSLDFGGQTYASTGAIKPALAAGCAYKYALTVKKGGISISGATIADWEIGGSYELDLKPVVPFGNKSLDEAFYGDFYFSDGSLADLNTDLTPEQAKAVIGIVYNPSYNSEDDKSSYNLDNFIDKKVHGYVVALTDANGGEPLPWATGNNGQTTTRLSTNVYTDTPGSDYNGYAHCQDIWTYIANHPEKSWQAEDFPAAYACKTYGTKGVYKAFAAPKSSSGWFLPALWQLEYMVHLTTEAEYAFDRLKGQLKDQQLLDHIKFPRENAPLYWSATEDKDNGGKAWGWDKNSGRVSIDKSEGQYRVRPILAF